MYYAIICITQSNRPNYLIKYFIITVFTTSTIESNVKGKNIIHNVGFRFENLQKVGGKNQLMVG